MKALINHFQNVLEQEALTTRKMLARVPSDKFDWRPHPKSMTLRELATHVAELPSWIGMTLYAPELDFAASPYEQEKLNTTEELLNFFEQTLADGRAQLAAGEQVDLSELWTLRNGEVVYVVTPKLDMLQSTFSQIVHHRAQLGVCLRLLDIKIPGSYGPSADENFEEVAPKAEAGVA